MHTPVLRGAFLLLTVSGVLAATAFREASAQGTPPAANWVRPLTGTSDADGEAFDVKFDSAGSVVACGSSELPDYFTVAKWDSGGNHLWTRTVPGAQSIGAPANSLAVDAEDNVIAVGGIYEAGTDGLRRRFFVTKWSSGGDLLWGRTVGVAGEARRAAIAPDGSILVAGWLAIAPFVADPAVVKLSPTDGAVLWTHPMDRSVDGNLQSIDGLTVSDAGDPIVCGMLPGKGFGVVRLDGATGGRVWTAATGLSGSAASVVLDGAGHVLAAGTTYGPPPLISAIVLKLDGATGTVLWESRLDTTPPQGSRARDVAVDGAGDVLVCGEFSRASAELPQVTTEFGVVKLSGADGETMWQRALPNSSSYWAYGNASAVQVGPENRVFAAGWTGNTGTRRDGTVAAWDADGTLLWRQAIDGPARSSYDDQFHALDVNAAGSAAVAGRFHTDYGAIFGVAVASDWYLQPRDPQVSPREHPSAGGESMVGTVIASTASPKSLVVQAEWDPLTRGVLQPVKPGLYSGKIPFPQNYVERPVTWALYLTAEDLFGFRWSEAAAPVTVARRPSGRLWVSDRKLKFGNVRVGDARVRKMVLRNLANTYLYVELGKTATPFGFHRASGLPPSTDGKSFVLPPRGRVEVKVSFSPELAGAAAYELRVTSSDPGRPVTTITLEGNGRD